MRTPSRRRLAALGRPSTERPSHALSHRRALLPCIARALVGRQPCLDFVFLERLYASSGVTVGSDVMPWIDAGERGLPFRSR